MTYDELSKTIAAMNEEQRGNDVTIYDKTMDEFFMLEDNVEFVKPNNLGDGILDEGHPFLVFVS